MIKLSNSSRKCADAATTALLMTTTPSQSQLQAPALATALLFLAIHLVWGFSISNPSPGCG
jgi:hypothetical protein